MDAVVAVPSTDHMAPMVSVYLSRQGSHDLTVLNMKFRKRYSHLISFYGGIAKAKIDFTLVRNRDHVLVTDANILPYETFPTGDPHYENRSFVHKADQAM